MTTLWRAADAEHPWFGLASFWATDREHAEFYLHAPGFGGPTLYRAEVTVPSGALLDLRSAPWSVLHDEFGLDREDYGAGELDHELYWSLVPVFAAAGYQWAVFTIGTSDEWIYLGDDPLPATVAA